MKTYKNRGFTLVELIVVIAIVAVLAGVLMLAINPAALLAKSRDSKRLEDMDVLNKAISLALAETEITLTATVSPGTSADTSPGNLDTDGTGYVSFTVPDGKTGLAKYIAALPADPINGANPNVGAPDLVYSYASDGTNWEMTAVMESADNAAKMTADGGDQADHYEIGTLLTLISP